MRAPVYLCLFLIPTVPAAAQEKPPVPGLFGQVIPQPTGENGYEELVRAAESLQRSELFKKHEGGSATLRQKRGVLADPPVRRALLLLEAGLKKPVTSPRATLTFSTLLPELSQFRNLGRLLAMQQYVQLADGKTRDAIQTTRLSLRFSRIIQMDTLIGGLVGAAITRLALSPLATHLDQLSAKDCEALYEVCTEWLALPDAVGGLIEGERRGIRASLEELRRDAIKKGPETIGNLLLSTDDDPRTKELTEDLAGLLKQDPAEFERTLTDAGKQVDAYLARQLQEAQKPAWQRSREVLEPGGGIAGRLASSVSTDFSRVMDRFTDQRLRVQLLAAHCAVLRYRWENDRLPTDLATLNLGVIGLDPFTGAPLEYRVKGARYVVASKGYVADADDPAAVDGRRPVSLVPADF